MRTLDKREEEILQIKEKRLGKKLTVSGIEYFDLFPRIVLCKLFGSEERYGVSMRSRRDEDNPLIGQTIAFVRALDSI